MVVMHKGDHVSKKSSFSVVIPVYNGAAYIEKAIRSCLAQTVLPDEIIVVNDGSTDETEEAVKNIGSSLVKLVNNEENKGPSSSRNLGLRTATSDWVMFLDADDSFVPEKVSVISNCLSNNNSIRAIGHAFTIPGQVAVQLPLQRQCEEIKMDSFKVLLRNPVVTPALTVRKDNELFFNETIHYAEDHDFILRTAEKYGLWYVDIPLCELGRVPMTRGGLSGKKWEMRKGEIRMYIDYCKRNHKLLFAPVLVLFSLTKHLYGIFIPGKRPDNTNSR